MTIKSILKNFLTSNIKYSDSTSYRRIIMVNSIMTLTAVILFIFTYIQFYIIQDYQAAILDAVAGILSLGNLVYLRIKKDIELSAFLAVVIFMVFMIIFINANQNTNFGLIWSIFLPFLAIRFTGIKKGLFLTIIFYFIMAYLAYNGIGIWNQGNWILVDFLRFIISGIVLTTIIYLAESAYTLADKELEQVRTQETEMLDKLGKQAITDALTQMYNRRHFNKKANEMLNTVKENDSFLALLILDIDYFKNYNDYYGHHAGDEVLIKVAKKLMDFSADIGYAFRMGGEEFAILGESHSSQEIVEKIKMLNQEIENLAIEHKDSAISTNLTVSCGLCIKKIGEETNIDLLYKKADKALYTAKDSGRNRLEITS